MRKLMDPAPNISLARSHRSYRAFLIKARLTAMEIS